MTSRKQLNLTTRLLGVGALSILLLNGCVTDVSENSSGTDLATDPASEEQTGGAFSFSFDPSTQSVDVPVNTMIRIQPSADLDADSVNTSTVKLTRTGDSPVEAKVAYAGGVIEITPVHALQAQTTYTATVTTGVRSATGARISTEASASFTTQAVANDLPANFSAWEDRMVKYGTALGERLMKLSSTQVRNPDGATLNEVYYDGQRVFYQIADYLGATGSERDRWHRYAQRARDIYVKGYLEPNNYRAAGFMRFAHGTHLQWLQDNSSGTLGALVKLRDNPTFSKPRADNTSWYYQKYSREIAYAIQANVLAERAGEPRQSPYMERLLDRALTHVNSWTTGNYLDPDSKWHFMQAFMGGLTASALIDYHEHTPDSRIPQAVKTLADWLWDNMWVANVNNSGYGAFKYVNRSVSGVGGPNPAPDLNMLIVPMYAWLYKETGDRVYRDRADLIFSGGVAMADLGNGKRFNQNYRTSFEYLRWRQEGLQRWGR